MSYSLTSNNLTTQTNQEQTKIPYRRYDEQSDRLFLVYYVLPPGFNTNKWGVSPTSLDANIHSALNKPVVVSKKNSRLPFHTRQAGNYVHPTLGEAAYSLGYTPKIKDYLDWQEKFAIGRVRSVDKRDKGYAWTLEITDPDAKNILKSEEYKIGIPGYTSPQILFPAGKYPNEEATDMHDHWMISHVALVDVPAYGYDKAGMAAKCFGAEQECMIQTRNASQEDLGFCIKQATIDLVQSIVNSSHDTTKEHPSHSIMAANETQSPVQPETVVTKTITDNNNTTTTIPQSPQPQPHQQTLLSSQEQTPEERKPEEDNPDNHKPAEEVKVNSIEEANATISQMSSLIKDLQKTVKSQGKELETIRTERKMARLSFIIPRDLFKSDESHLKEVQKTMSENVSEPWLIEYWKTKRELAMAQHSTPKMEQPLIAKSASANITHEVPDYGSSNKTTQRSVIDKQLELQRMIIDGGL